MYKEHIVPLSPNQKKKNAAYNWNLIFIGQNTSADLISCRFWEAPLSIVSDAVR